MIGYKVCKADGVRVIVTLEIPADAITNMSRKDIVVRETAKHRTNKAKVLKIEDEVGNLYSRAESFAYDQKTLEYILNEMIYVEYYDMNLEEVCAPGIHYFLEKRCAEFYGLESIQNGLYQEWHDNGQKWVECMYVNGQENGLHQEWHTNGQKANECMYVNGQQEGLHQEWHYNGQKAEECTYVNDERNGLYQEWHYNGQKESECTYVNGQREGLYQSWHENGQREEKCTYVNGYQIGLYQSWYENGQKDIECIYVNGKKEGLYQRWHENGQKWVESMYVNGEQYRPFYNFIKFILQLILLLTFCIYMFDAKQLKLYDL